MSSDSPGLPLQDRPLRQRWISAFARSAPKRLRELLDELDTGAVFDVLRPAEHGLVMARAQAGGGGPKFNIGEMTVTRCSVRSDTGAVGHGYVAGRNSRHAEIAARLDALMQNVDQSHAEPIVVALESEIETKARARQAASAPTRVEFFTMVRGEDE